MKEWEIVEFIPGENLDELWDIAVRAFSGTSFEPEERAAMYIRDYEEVLKNDIEELSNVEGVTEDVINGYRLKFTDKVRDLFARHSRIISTMITGSANFPAERNEKANRSYDNAFSEFQAWRERYAKLAKKKIDNAKSPEERSEEEWRNIRQDIFESATACADIDNGRIACYRSAFVNSIFGKVERMAKNGKYDLVVNALDYIKDLQDKNEIGLKKPIFTERHSIWKLREVAEKAVKVQEERAGREESEFEFRGCRIVKNYAENRLQLIFDGKPEASMINALKQNGFRWSPRFTAWQRQLTSNSYYGAARVFFCNDVHNEEQTEFLSKIAKL